MELLSYIASLIATVLGLFEPFGKKMKTILIFTLLGNILVGISYLLIEGYSGAAVCGTATVQLIINYTFAVKEKKLPRWLILCHLACFIAVNILAFSAWYDILALIASALFVVSVAQDNAKYYRLLYIGNSLVWIFYDILAHAYGNLATHGILFTATIIAMLYRDVVKKKTPLD